MILLIALLSVLLVFILFRITSITIWVLKAAKMTANIPGPKTLPLVGNALSFANMKNPEDSLIITQTLLKENNKPPDRISKLWLGPKLIIALGNPKYIEAVLTSKDALNKDSFYDYLGLVIDGMVVNNGKKWHDLRKPLNRILTKALIESRLTKMHQKAIKICRLWEDKVEDGKMFNLRPDLTNYFADNICDNLLGGYKLNELDNKKLDFNGSMERAINLLQKLMLQFPGNISVTYAKLSKTGRQLAKETRVFFDESLKILRATRENMETKDNNDEEQTKNFFNVLMELKTRDNLSEEETALKGLDVLIGGFDTTSVTSACVLLMLAMYPEHQKAVYQEQLKIIGDDPNIIPTWDQLTSMEYLGRVIKEVLRLFCPLAIMRTLSKDMDFDDYKLPKGCTLYIMLYYLHRDPQFWSHPEEFYPDHFLSEAILNRPKGSYFPFSYGPRVVLVNYMQ
ncbi:hypothetical protein O3M35_013318 [Rhynocoris fuscipes]|uniref:Cytochrome P450 n=1 Tax=Rhynocoris fuscipes TaxID=488301 RepID=A0AAW1CDS5_9HEMI